MSDSDAPRHMFLRLREVCEILGVTATQVARYEAAGRLETETRPEIVAGFAEGPGRPPSKLYRADSVERLRRDRRAAGSRADERHEETTWRSNVERELDELRAEVRRLRELLRLALVIDGARLEQLRQFVVDDFVDHSDSTV